MSGTKRLTKAPDLEFLCRQFYVLTKGIRDCTSMLRSTRCTEECEAEYDNDGHVTFSGNSSCLTNYFTAVSIGEGASLVLADMCDPCKQKLSTVQKRRELRHALAGMKRRIANAGAALEDKRP